MDNTKVTPMGTSSTTPNNDVVVNSDEPVVATSTETKTVETPAATTTTSSTTTVQPQKKSSCLKVGLISCAVLLILLIICAVVGVLAGGTILRSATTGGDFDRSQYKTYDPNNVDEEGTIEDKFLAGKEQNPGEEFTITVTEDELLNQLGSNSENSNLAQSIFLNMREDSLDLKVDLGKLLNNLPEKDKPQGLDPKTFDGVFLSAEIGTSADGKSFDVKNASTGNTIVDSFVGDSFAKSLEEGLNEGLNSNLQGEDYKIDNIEIKENALSITFAPGAAETTPTPTDDNGYFDY